MLSYDPAKALWADAPRTRGRDLCTPVLTAASFNNVQETEPDIKKWVRTGWCIYTRTILSCTENEIMKLTGEWIEVKNGRKETQMENNKDYVFYHMQILASNS